MAMSVVIQSTILQMEKEQMEKDVAKRCPSLTPTQSRFHPSDLIAMMDKNLLQSIENIYRCKEDGLDPLQFTRFFMNCIEHHENQSPFLAAGLAELYQIISNGKNRIKFSQLTDYICQQIVEADNESHELSAKWIPIKGNQQTYLRHPPIITGRTQQIFKVWLNKDLLDNGKHQDAINHACFSECHNKIYCLESLADWIGVYNSSLKLQRRIKPSSFKAKKDSAVISISFSEREERLGAILKDFSISFWDATDNYSFEKSINTTKYCQQFQNQIWYLEFLQTWITSDLEGKLYLWNLERQQPKQIIKCRHRSKISGVCEIMSIKLIAVAQEQKGTHAESAKIQLISLSKGEIVAQIDTRFERRMLHTLKYSEQYQVLLAAGYEKRIKMFEINNTYLDSSLKGELLGHESAVTCFNLIRKTPMVVSADDRGKVKVWNIKNFKCMQTLDFTDKVSITKILDMGCEKKIALMGSRIIMLNLENKPENIQEVTPLKTQVLGNSLVIFSGQDIRRVDLRTGKLENIDYQFNKAISEVTSTIITTKKEIVTGNDKGQISFYCQHSEKVRQTSNWHNGPVQYLEEDTINDLILTYSIQSGFIVIGKPNHAWEEVRQLKFNSSDNQINSIVLSAYHSFLCFINFRTVFVVDYEQFRIYHKFDFRNECPISLAFINGLSLLLVGTNTGALYIYQLKKENSTPYLMVNCNQMPITRLVTDLQCHQSENAHCLDHCFISCAFSDGSLQNIDLSDYAKTISFKPGRNDGFYFNPHRQIRQNFDIQIKKMNKEEKVENQSFPLFQGKIYSLPGHSGGVTSLLAVQNWGHFLVSTGKDKRIKIWNYNQLIGDTNINLPLPYLWKVDLFEEKSEAKRILGGLQLIQMVFKRFGKDISIGQAQLFKTSSQANVSGSFLTSLPQTQRKLKKKPTLFQDQFTPIDLHYDRIKKEHLMSVGGPSLKRMQVSKKIETLQQEWNTVKQRQQRQKNQLIDNIFYRAQKNDEKQSILSILKDKQNYNQAQKPKEEEVGVVRKLQEQLSSFVDERNKEHRYSQNNSPSKQGKEQLSKVLLKSKVIRRSNSKITLQTYFNEKFSQGRRTANSRATRSVQVSPRVSKHQVQAELCCEMTYKKQNNFRIMLKEMRQKLSKSKNRNSETYQSCSEFQRVGRTALSKRKYRTKVQVLNELDNQISTFRSKQKHQ